MPHLRVYFNPKFLKYSTNGIKPKVEDICVADNLVLEFPIGCDLETLFHLSNKEGNPLGLPRFLCCGDIVQLDSTYYLVDVIGFTRLS